MASNIVIDSFVSLLSYKVDDRGLKTFVKGVGSATKAALSFVSVTTAALGGVTAALGVINKKTAEQIKLAEATGQSVDTLQAITAQVKSLGFTYDNVNDLAEELNNKIGESKGLKQITPVKESLQIIGLSFKEISKLNPQQQFEKITESLLKMKDDQKAVAAADILFGGEANRIIGALRTRKQTLAQIVAQHKRLNLETEESRKGAVAYAESWGKFLGIIESGKKLFAGVLGKELKTYLDGMVEWVALNKEIVQSNINSAVSRAASAFGAAVKVMTTLGKILDWVAKSLGTNKVTMLAWLATLSLLARHPVMAAMTAILLVVDDLISYFEGAESVTGALIAKFNEFPTSGKIAAFIAGITAAVAALFVVAKGLGILTLLAQSVGVVGVAVRGLAFGAVVLAGALSLPVLVVVGVIAALAALAAAIYVYWNDIITFLSQPLPMPDLSWESLKEMFASIGEVAANVFLFVIPSSVVRMSAKIIGKVAAMVAKIKGLLAGIVSDAKERLANIGEGITAKVGKVKAFFQGSSKGGSRKGARPRPRGGNVNRSSTDNSKITVNVKGGSNPRQTGRQIGRSLRSQKVIGTSSMGAGN